MTSSIPSRVRLIDVGPRDGLQNEKTPVPAAVKVELVHRLQAAGLKEIEVTSYVSPKWVPQMADNAEVMAGIARRGGVLYSVLTPNLKGFEAALAGKPDEIVAHATRHRPAQCCGDRPARTVPLCGFTRRRRAPAGRRGNCCAPWRPQRRGKSPSCRPLLRTS